ncbi:XRE family transcriptional regulator [bacterium D16-51]|nr:XRE family transcriptional regulator [bacterium D16-59]RKI54310.1 XRE family transcriptional regulator [bacterium D16-51]
MNNVQFVSTIKLLCKAKGITVSTLLVKCSLRKSLIYDVEKRNAKPSIEIVESIADYLDCSVDYLLGRTDNPEINK